MPTAPRRHHPARAVALGAAAGGTVGFCSPFPGGTLAGSLLGGGLAWQHARRHPTHSPRRTLAATARRVRHALRRL